VNRAYHADHALCQDHHEPGAFRFLPARHLRQHNRLRHELPVRAARDEHGLAIRLFQARNAPAARFNRAKTYVIAASALAFLVWFFGFMVVAGEWFAMWQSATWNGQEAAFRFYVAVLAVLIFINQLDVDLPGTEPLASAPKASRSRRKQEV
jgi:hypothetical protein